MGLDPAVYCNCFETGVLRPPERFAGRIVVSPEGCADLDSEELDESIEYDRWRADACPHELGILHHERIGNIALVAFLRDQLERRQPPPRFILERVVYSGTHCGDRIEPAEFDALATELGTLADAPTPEIERLRVQLQNLIDCAKPIGRPISF